MRTRKIIVEVTEGEHTRWQKSDAAILLAVERQLSYVMHGATAGTVPSVRAYYTEQPTRPDPKQSAAWSPHATPGCITISEAVLVDALKRGDLVTLQGRTPREVTSAVQSVLVDVARLRDEVRRLELALLAKPEPSTVPADECKA